MPIGPTLLDALAAQMAGKAPGDLLFTSPEGQPLRLRNWRQRVFDPAVKAAGIERLTPHQLRHTAASIAVASGAGVKLVQRMLGHADAAMTLNVYAGLFDTELDSVAEQVDRVFSAACADSMRTDLDSAPLPMRRVQGL